MVGLSASRPHSLTCGHWTAPPSCSLPMTAIKKILVVLLLAAAIGALTWQQRQVAGLRVENQAIREQVQPLGEQVNGLLRERERLRAELQQVKTDAKRGEGDKTELMRLRGEVGPLRQMAQELQDLRASAARAAQAPLNLVAAARVPPPPNLDVDQIITMRAQDLWQRLHQSPTNWIPELKFLKDEDWRKVALGQRWESEEEARKAFGQLRNAAKERFMDRLGSALQNYGKATSGQLPAKLSDVASYFDPPVDSALLDRYELTPQRNITTVRLSQNPDELIVKEKNALDPAAGETLQLINLRGNLRGTIGVTPPPTTARP